MTVNLPEDAMRELKTRAQKSGTSEEQLVTSYLTQWLKQPVASDDAVMAVTRRIIEEDRKLLERLA
jgi:hypothetical protein